MSVFTMNPGGITFLTLYIILTYIMVKFYLYNLSAAVYIVSVFFFCESLYHIGLIFTYIFELFQKRNRNPHVEDINIF